MEKLKQMQDALFAGDSQKVEELVKKSIEENVPVDRILNYGLIAGMQVVGDKFKCNDIFIPEVLLSARAMSAGLTILEPLLAKYDIKPVGKVIIGTVKGDLHDIGKNLVAMMLKGAGFAIIDLGIDVAPEAFLKAAQSNEAQILAMSSLLTTSMPSMKSTINLLKEKGLKVKTMIGGAPLTQEYADTIGADGYATDASRAVEKAKELLK